MSADNQQETAPSSIRNFYYTGFCAGEMSCSIIRAFDRSQKSYYYTPDLTISNKDIRLLYDVNRSIAQGKGIVTKIKGGYNLSIRGKKRVKDAPRFFETYPIIAGEIAGAKIETLKLALAILNKQKNCLRRLPSQEKEIERFRSFFKRIKGNKIPLHFVEHHPIDNEARGYFLAGIIDAEGSIDFKKSGKRTQPYFALAMRDREIINLLKDFLSDGNVRKRCDGVYHYETNAVKTIIKIINLFTKKYPSRHRKTKKRMEAMLSRILNDCTRSRKTKFGRYSLISVATQRVRQK